MDNTKVFYRSGFAFIFLGILSLFFSLIADINSWFLHSVFCFLGFLIFLTTLIKSKNIISKQLLYNHQIIFLTFFFVYFIFGAFYFSVNEIDVIKSELKDFFITAKSALQVDSVNSLGFGIALICSVYFKPKLFTFIVPIKPAEKNKDRESVLKLLLLAIMGAGAKFYVFLGEMGSNEEFVSGIIKIIDIGFTSVAIIYASMSDKKINLIIAILLTVFAVSIGILQFNKANTLIPILCFFVGLSVHKKSKSLITIGFLISLLLVSQLGNPFLFAREKVKSIKSISVASRLELIKDGFDSNFTSEEEDYDSWRRISYLDSQSAAVNFYDQNNGGNDINVFLWAFIPRFLVKDKPILSSSGFEFYTKITGNVGSSTGMGIFINGYYNLGWAGVIIYSILSGYIIAQTSGLAKKIIECESIYLYPLVFIGLFCGFRIDGTFLIDYFGVFIILLYFLILLRFLSFIRK